MRYILIFIILVFVGALTWVLLPKLRVTSAQNEVVVMFRKSTDAYYESLGVLRQRLEELNNDSLSILAARKALIECRLQYKRSAYFIAYYFPDQAIILNGPPVAEVEAGMNEYRDPSGMQVIEAVLYAPLGTKTRGSLLQQVMMLQRSTQSMLSLFHNFAVEKEEVWYALSLELVRVYTLYITGYDAPQLKSGIREAAVSVATIDSVSSFLHLSPQLHTRLQEAKKYLLAHPDFDSFDRLYFITHLMLPSQRLLNEHVYGSPVTVSARSAFNFNAVSLFAPDGLHRDFFPGEPSPSDSSLAALGRRLFTERRLSANHDRSCATCHSPQLFFSDRLQRNKNREHTGDLPRNTPSLFYAAYQWHQFWDGRVRTLAEQAVAVLNDTLEMKGTDQSVTDQLQLDTTYRAQFRSRWAQDTLITEAHIAAAIAAYVATLSPFHSPFDRYMNGDHTSLTPSQQRGFNIFMGKALCGTCHFAPLFNGLLPPLYNTTEFEILGTPLNDDFKHLQKDPDTGRSRIIASLPQGAFKTPTVRNSAATAPYMHNGGFKTLQSIIAFYDKGGGQGLGLHVEGQTLSSEPLHLDSTEKADLLAFIESLTDSY